LDRPRPLRCEKLEAVEPDAVLSLNEWAVLAAVAEGETHGFALAREFAPDGAIGRIWTIPRPLVYRAIGLLAAKGLVAEQGWAPGASAPRRRLVAVTPSGRSEVSRWLSRPIAHVRDARSDLLLKLLFLDRLGEDPSVLLAAQRAFLEPRLASLRAQFEVSTGFDQTLVRWRLYSNELLARFLEDLLADVRSPVQTALDQPGPRHPSAARR
jgi:DNA-binding PadR family transcriptional regulator